MLSLNYHMLHNIITCCFFLHLSNLIVDKQCKYYSINILNLYNILNSLAYLYVYAKMFNCENKVHIKTT